MSVRFDVPGGQTPRPRRLLRRSHLNSQANKHILALRRLLTIDESMPQNWKLLRERINRSLALISLFHGRRSFRRLIARDAEYRPKFDRMRELMSEHAEELDIPFDLVPFQAPSPIEVESQSKQGIASAAQMKEESQSPTPTSLDKFQDCLEIVSERGRITLKKDPLELRNTFEEVILDDHHKMRYIVSRLLKNTLEDLCLNSRLSESDIDVLLDLNAAILQCERLNCIEDLLSDEQISRDARIILNRLKRSAERK